MHSRRHFLVQAAALAAAASIHHNAEGAPMPDLKISRIEAIPMVYPTVGRFKFFEGPDGKPLGRQAVLVKITADDGSVGFGQSVPTNKWSYETLETVTTTIERYLTPVLLGQNVADLASIQKAMDRIIAPSFSTGQPICKAGIDLALFDLTGKVLKRTAQQRWNRKGKDKITLSWTLNPVKLDDVPGLIEQGRQRGYRNFNIKVAPDVKFDIELTKIVKRLVPDGFLWADANGGYDEASALEAAPKLADAGAAVLEQPVRPSAISALQKLKKQGALPIILDESIVNHAELDEFIQLKMLDGVAMKPARCGGLTEACRQIEILERHNLMFLGSGLTDPDLSLAASLLLYGAYGLKYPAALNGPQFLAGSILKKPLDPIDGALAVPEGVGLGVEVDEAKVERLRVKV